MYFDYPSLYLQTSLISEVTQKWWGIKKYSDMISLVAVESRGAGEGMMMMMTMTLPVADNTQQSSGIFTLIIYCANANESDQQTSCESNKTLKLS